MILENPIRTKQLNNELVCIWEASVRETHAFLQEKDISNLKPFVVKGVQEIQNLMIVYENNNAIGFMGIENEKVEMLFLKPECIGKGIGRQLITKAIQEYNISFVDVNEQNPNAVAFYKHIGFWVYERTTVDEQGNPFPILKMRL